MSEFSSKDHELQSGFDLEGLANWLAAHHPEVDFEPSDWEGEDENDVLGNILTLTVEYDMDFVELCSAAQLDIAAAAFILEITDDAEGLE